MRVVTSRRLLGRAVAALAIGGLIAGWLLLNLEGIYFRDAAAYWRPDFDDLYGASQVGVPSTYLYSPAFAQLAAPFGLLPWTLFAALWSALNLGLLVWMAGVRLAAVLFLVPFSPVNAEISTGNIHLLLAAVIVLGFRFPGLWAFTLLTKVAPGVGVLWFAGARRWRSLATALGTTAAISLISFVVAPGLWAEWFAMLQRSAEVPVPAAIAVIPGPLWARALVAALVALYAGATGRRWLVPLAVFLALPVTWSSGLSVLVAALPLAAIDWRASVRRAADALASRREAADGGRWRPPTGHVSARRVPASTVAVAAFFGLVALPRAAIPVIDGDAFWHIRAGQEVLATGSVPTHDTWSIAGDGMRWVSQDWLANVVMALPYELGDIGLALLSVVFALLVVLALAVLWRAIGARDPRIGWLGRLIWLTVGLTVAGPAIGVRVQVIDLTLAVVVIGLLWVYLADPRPRWLIGLPLVALLWTNLHAGWLLLFLLGGAVLTGELVDRSLGRRLDPPPLPWRSSIALGIALVVSLGAIAVNPNGLAMYLYPFETAAIEAHRDFLAEWSPPDIATLPGQLFAGFVVIGVVPAFLLGRRRMRVADALVLAGLTFMALTAARFLLVVGPIGAAVVALTLAPVISQTRFGRATAPILDRLSRPRPALGAVNVGLAVALVLLGLFATWGRVSPAEQGHLIGKHMPVDAVDWIVANDPGSRPFNTYSWGGYLGLMRPDTPIFIDGRSDIYGDAPIREYAHTIMLTIDPALTLDRYEIDHVLFNTDHHFARWLDASPEWEQVYSDPLASVWVRAVE